MNFEDLHIFTTIVNTRSFTTAAEQLGLSKQFVSRRLAALEQSVSTRLLVRNTRKLSVTDIGMAFFHQAQRIIDEVYAANQLLYLHHKKLVGFMRISIPMTYGLHNLYKKIIEFKNLNTDLMLDVEMEDRFVDLVGESVDIALRVGNLTDSTLIARSLGSLPMALCASPEYLQREGPIEKAEDLIKHKCLLYGHEEQRGWNLCVDGKSKVFAVTGHVCSNNGEFIKEAAEAGLGIALLPLFIVERAFEKGKLVKILPFNTPIGLPINIVYPKHKQNSLIIREFISFMLGSVS
ncbi:LysR family transcriptional regulator [Serratia sp. UGAL515B_01]|nr:LysR family transcriptional regulator [Serratia sp. UGAL515B_01]